MASPRYRKALWIALLVNVAMFVVEVSAGLSVVGQARREIAGIAPAV